MASIRTLTALSVAALVTACASTETTTGPAPGRADEHTSHHPAAAASAAAQPRMMAMREMHEKMMNAKTPEARQALMADHMKAMQDGMDMMKGMGGMGAGMGGSKGMPPDSATRQQMTEQRRDMMQMMMEMMMDRLPAQPAAPAKN